MDGRMVAGSGTGGSQSVRSGWAVRELGPRFGVSKVKSIASTCELTALRSIVGRWSLLRALSLSLSLFPQRVSNCVGELMRGGKVVSGVGGRWGYGWDDLSQNRMMIVEGLTAGAEPKCRNSGGRQAYVTR